MTDAAMLGAGSILGAIVLTVAGALSVSTTTRIFRLALAMALLGGLLGLALEPAGLHISFLCGAAMLGSLGASVCAVVMVIDGIVRGNRIPPANRDRQSR